MAVIEPESVYSERGWQTELRDAVRDLSELGEMLGLSFAALRTAGAEPNAFSLLVPRPYIRRMRRGDIDDPLLRQVLPLARERAHAPGYNSDPLDELRHADGGIIHKYHARALLITTAACPVHCRYCFRRAFPYADYSVRAGAIERIVDTLRADPSIREIILSGGDPLALSNRRLSDLIGPLTGIPSLTTLRIHTRFPILIPSRIDDDLCEMLADVRLKTVVVVHANHGNEIDGDVSRALARLEQATDQLLNQSVLLAGVNDRLDALKSLSECLFDSSVLPYYLHLLDPVAGAAHFEVPERRALDLVAGLRAVLPGYLVPRLVRDVPGAAGKTLIG